jgi:multicomponent Na+:H+ antiporter subunit E
MFINLIYIFIISIFWYFLAGYESIIHHPVLSLFAIFSIICGVNFIKVFPKKLYNPIYMVRYIFWLIKEIILSTIAVKKIIWSGSVKIKPTIIEIDTKFKANSPELAIYGNSITLTPGTLSIDIIGSKIIIHSLNTKFLRDLKSGEMERKIIENFHNLQLGEDKTIR